MSETDRQSWFPFEELVGKLPFFGQDGLWPVADIHQYVQDVMKRSMPQQAPVSEGRSLPQVNVFETHRSVIVRVTLPAGVDPKHIRVRHNEHMLRIDGLRADRALRVRLPALVHTQRSSSKIKERVLEVRLLKRKRLGREREVLVEY